MTSTPSSGAPVRTRFAPSPTGRLHLGNVRVAVFNWLFTRRHGGAFVLRVEDTDVERNVAGAEDHLMEDLRWLGLEWDEGPDVGGPYGPYRQSERWAAYQGHLGALLASGHVYRCFCAEDEGAGDDRRYAGTCRSLDAGEAERRALDGEPHVLRLRTPGDAAVEIEDEVRGRISFPGQDIDDFVLRRRDGRPTYNFAVVADDVDMAITHVIRGAGHLSNTPKQALLFDALGRPRPRFVHLPNVLAPDGGKLSKRSGAAGVGELREAGMLPDAIVNYLSLLGWSHPEEREILTRSELAEAVGLDRIRASDMAYDPEKLRWVAAQHLAALSDADFVAGLAPHLDRDRFPQAEAVLPELAALLRSRMATFGEINVHLTHVYPPEGPAWDAARDRVRNAPEAASVVEHARVELGGLERWDRDGIRGAFKAAGVSAGVKGRALFHPLREALTGMEEGPDLAQIAVIVGRAETLRRMDAIAR